MKKNRQMWLILMAFTIVHFVGGYGGLGEGAGVYFEDFDARMDGVTVNGVDSWSVTNGEAMSAVTQDDTTYDGSAIALRLVGDEAEPISLRRQASYGSITPAWIEYVIYPGMGEESMDVPTSGIAAVTFDVGGTIKVTDGDSWVETGKTFSIGNWYRVTLKLDFAMHTYDVYITDAAATSLSFTPDLENLDFIDATISSLGEVGFSGSYNTTDDTIDDSVIDELIVHFVEKLQITSTPQIIKENRISEGITVQIQNSLSDPQVAWRDIPVTLTSSSSSGEFSLDDEIWVDVSELTFQKGTESLTFYYKDSVVGKPIITVSEANDRGWDDAMQQQEIIADPLGFAITVASPQIAGDEFQITITAKDEEGNIDETYNGSVALSVNYITPSTGSNILSPTSATGFQQGILKVDARYPDAGSIKIVVIDEADATQSGISGDILVNPASFQVALTNVSSKEALIVGQPVSMTIKALNSDGDVTPNYQGPADLVVNLVDPIDHLGGGLSPTGISQAVFKSGVATLDVIYNRWGTIMIEARDDAYPKQKGVSEEMRFIPDAIRVAYKEASDGRNFFYTGETITLEVSTLDVDEQVILNYFGTMDLTATIGLAVPQQHAFSVGDQGKYTFTSSAETSGFYYFEAFEPENKLQSESLKIEVKKATLVVVSTFAPIGSAEVTIHLVDEDGNIITSENSMTIMVEIEEEMSDFSAVSSATLQPVTFKNGRARIIISNSQSEVVTISPMAGSHFDIQKGTVTFGRITKKGVGTFMWRELKDYRRPKDQWKDDKGKKDKEKDRERE